MVEKLTAEGNKEIGSVSVGARRRVEEDRITEIEEWKESKEKMERKNNIVIFGWNGKDRIEKKEIADFFQEEIGLENMEESIEEIRQTGTNRKMVWVKMKKLEDKKKIMERKAMLKGKKVFIENNRTKKEREEQKELKKRVWIARNQGAKNVKVGFGRLWVEGVMYRWDGFEVIGLCETWVEEKGWEVTKNRLPSEWSWDYIPAERVERRESARGGIILGVRKEIAGQLVEKRKGMIKREVRVGKKMWDVYSIYNDREGREMLEELDELDEWVKEGEEEREIIIGGDWNARIGEMASVEELNGGEKRWSEDPIVNSEGRMLMDLIDRRG
ncbi:Protein of unknown function [Cotesia congregata]|uniref:Endonuclease/exonuclease/phosphatase domain-containing protein n=1 Tax=Cotesia congregata TaxID=51543 RepID=A0A8J2HCC6_COTCN|nr:Protein of unknown function [Cotesia congregata]